MIRKFALVFGILFLLAGIAGFVPVLTPHPEDSLHPAVDAAHGFLLGIFPVNAIHNLIHIGIGLWGIGAARSAHGPIAFARGIAVIYALLAVLGMFPATNTLFGLAPLHGHDIWLHAAAALVAAYFGFIVPREVRMTAAAK